MTLGSKISLIAITGTGIIGGSAGITYFISQPNNLKEALIKAGFTPLSKDNTDHTDTWTKLAKKYSEANQTPKLGQLTIELLSNKDLKEGDLGKFQQECESLFIKKPKDTDYLDSLKKAEAWCIKESQKLTRT